MNPRRKEWQQSAVSVSGLDDARQTALAMARDTGFPMALYRTKPGTSSIHNIGFIVPLDIAEHWGYKKGSSAYIWEVFEP